MKKATKFFMAALLLGLCSFGYSQDVKVNINNQDATTKDDCPYRINGICITEDIGGVDASFKDGCTSCNSFHSVLVLHNYNSFPVNVTYSIEYEGGIKNGVAVLGVEGEKKIDLPVGPRPETFSLNGIIVRKQQ